MDNFNTKKSWKLAGRQGWYHPEEHHIPFVPMILPPGEKVMRESTGEVLTILRQTVFLNVIDTGIICHFYRVEENDLDISGTDLRPVPLEYWYGLPYE